MGRETKVTKNELRMRLVLCRKQTQNEDESDYSAKRLLMRRNETKHELWKQAQPTTQQEL